MDKLIRNVSIQSRKGSKPSWTNKQIIIVNLLKFIYIFSDSQLLNIKVVILMILVPSKLQIIDFRFISIFRNSALLFL